MTYTEPTTETIPVQLGVKAYNMKASGTIYRGQGVALVPNMDSYVYVPDASGCRLFGIADYGAYHNSSISVWGLGNIVHACISSASTTAGTWLGLSSEGVLSADVQYPSSALLLENAAAAYDFLPVLLVDKARYA